MSTVLTLRAAAGVIAAQMAAGHGTPMEIAAAEDCAGILFDPERAAALQSAVRAQVDAEWRSRVTDLEAHLAWALHLLDDVTYQRDAAWRAVAEQQREMQELRLTLAPGHVVALEDEPVPYALTVNSVSTAGTTPPYDPDGDE